MQSYLMLRQMVHLITSSLEAVKLRKRHDNIGVKSYFLLE